MSVLSLIRQFQGWHATGADLVLATVFETQGHTYSKPGIQMLISGDRYQGMVSGGCLEGDISEHAMKVSKTGKATTISYDLRATPENELIGLGVGCEGQISLLLQKLDQSYEPFSSVAKRRLGYEKTYYAVVVDSTDLALGTTVLFDRQQKLVWGNRVLADRIDNHYELPCMVTVDTTKLLCGSFDPLPRLLILGAGEDARPLVQCAVNMGWLVTVSDNRPGLLDAMAEYGPEEMCLAQATSLELDLSVYDAVVIMSHHLEKDRQYLKVVCDSKIPYIGLLGPISRGQRLLADIKKDPQSVAGRLRSPVGLDIGADSPETIALSIMSEIQAVLQGRKGLPLTDAV